MCLEILAVAEHQKSLILTIFDHPMSIHRSGMCRAVTEPPHMTALFKKRGQYQKSHFRDIAKTKNMFFFRKKSIFLKMIGSVLIRISKQV